MKRGKRTESHRFLIQAEKITGKELREHCFKMLFLADFYPTQEEAIAQPGQYLQSPKEDDIDESGILQVLHRVGLEEVDSEYFRARTANIIEKILEIDEKLNQAAAGWKTKHAGKVGLTVLRLALYEVLYDDAIPEKVFINETVELAKKFGGNDLPSFMSGMPAKFVIRGARVAGDARATGDAKVSEESRTYGETQEPQETHASRETPESKKNEAQTGFMASVYAVSQVTIYIRNIFTQDLALNRTSVRGETSNCKYHVSGHICFTLKDGGVQTVVTMFAGQRKGLDFKFREDQGATVSETVDVYERGERYQLYAEKIIREGRGGLFRQFGRLRNELEGMGIFGSCHGQPIPKYTRKMGIVTASTGAVTRDVVNISIRKNPYVQLILYPALVQEEQVEYSITKGTETLDRMGLDVLIVGRGGGSAEGLWTSNEEMVARAIFNCTTPVIPAVGHKTDMTTADYVVDLRAPMSSAAAELVVFGYSQFVEQANLYRQTSERSMERRVKKPHLRLDQRGMRLKLLSPQRQLSDRRQRLADVENRLGRMLEEGLGVSRCRLEDRRRRLEAQMAAGLTEGEHRPTLLSRRLDDLPPLKKLGGRYGFATDARDRAFIFIVQAGPGDITRVSVKDGCVDARVVETESMKLPGSEEQRMPRKKTGIQEKEENKTSIKENFARLEDIIREPEVGDSTLEESFTYYKAGMKLVKSLNGQIDNIEKQIQILSGGDEDE